jgi:hypothetical protein
VFFNFAAGGRMPDTIVGLKTSDLANNFVGFMNPENVGPLENAVMVTLNAAPYNMGVIAVTASIEAGGRTVKFTLNAPNDLDPATVKGALR